MYRKVTVKSTGLPISEGYAYTDVVSSCIDPGGGALVVLLQSYYLVLSLLCEWLL